MASRDMLKLIEDYEIGDKYTKELPKRKYGARQIQIVVENNLTTKYLKVCI